MRQVQLQLRMQRALSLTLLFSTMLGFLSSVRAETTVALWQSDKEAAVSITFDDGLFSQFDNAFPLLQQRGLKGTFFIISSDIDPDDLEPLILNGQEVGSHSVSHPDLTRLKKNQKLEDELGDSQLYLQDLTGQDVLIFAYPYGEYNQDVINITDDYYIAGRTAFPYALNSSSPALYELYVIGPHGPDDNADPIVYLKNSVDLAIAENKWAIEMFHEIDNPSGWDNVSSEAFSAHLDYLVENEPNVWVAPMGTVSEYIYERDTASITTLVSGSNIISLDLQCGLDNRFDAPLTLLTLCPPGWESGDIQVRQGQTEQIADLVSKNGSLYIMYDAIPDRDTIELSPSQPPIIPDVTGQVQATAEANIVAATFTVGVVTTAYSDTVPAGDVISQSPAGLTAAVSGTAVDLVVSLGLPIIPNVTGQAQATAEANIVAATFTVGTVTTAYSDTVAAGNVISQGAVGPATSGTAVDLVVSDGPVPRVISGHLLEPDDATAIEGILIETNDGSSSDMTDPNGYYELVVDYGWSGIVEPNAIGYIFDPNEADRTLIPIVSDAVLDLTGSLEAFVISGTILEDDAVTPIPGVTVTPENGGGYYTSKYDSGGVGVTDPNGYYEVLVDYGWSGDVTPTDNAYAFDPNKLGYSTVVDGIMDQDYTGTMLTFSISGYIKNINDVPVEGVSVTADSGGIDATDDTGYYEVWVPYDWSGTVTATKADYTFVSPTLVLPVTADQAGDFAAQLDSDIDNSGDVGLPDLLILCSNWLSPGDLSMGDLDGNADVDMRDFVELAEYWKQ